MATTEKQRKAKSYIAGAVVLLEDLQGPFGADVRVGDLEPALTLLDEARALVDGKDEAREQKNAADRARRAKTKTRTWSPPKRKSTPKRPAAGGIIDAL